MREAILKIKEKVIDILYSPMLFLRLTAHLRNIKVIIAYFVILTIIGIILFFYYLAKVNDEDTYYSYSYRYYSEEYSDRTLVVGRNAFGVIQGLLICAIFLIVPSFAGSSLSLEKEKKTFDLLVTSFSTPLKIVIGKLYSGLVLSFIIFFAILPFICINFFFGGINIWDIILMYITFLMITSMIIIVGISISGRVKNSIISIIFTYIVSFFLIGAFLSFVMSELGLYGELFGFGPLHSYLFSDYDRYIHGIYYPPTWAIIVLYLCIIFCWLTISSYAFVTAINSLKPEHANKSTIMKIWFLVFLAVCLAIMIYFITSSDEDLMADDDFLVPYLYVVLVVFTLASNFCSEKAVLPLHIRRKIEKVGKRSSFASMLYPGPIRSLWFVLTMIIIVIVATCILFEVISPLKSPSYYEKSREEIRNSFYTSIFFIVSWVLFISSFSGFLSYYIRKPGVKKIIFIVTILLFCIIPLILGAMYRSQTTYYDIDQQYYETLLAMSPLVTIANLFDNPEIYSNICLTNFLLVVVSIILIPLMLEKNRAINKELIGTAQNYVSNSSTIKET